MVQSSAPNEEIWDNLLGGEVISKDMASLMIKGAGRIDQIDGLYFKKITPVRLMK